MTNKTMGKLLTIALLLICSVSMATVHEVQIVGTTFSPQNIQIEAGDTVRWINNGGFHNIRSNDGSFRCSRVCSSMRSLPWKVRNSILKVYRAVMNTPSRTA